MGQYDNRKKLIIASNLLKDTITTSIPGHVGQLVTGGIGNEGVDLGDWIQERIDDGTIDVGSSSGGNTDLTFSQTTNTLTILSSTGTDVILPAATSLLAGVMSATDKSNLSSLATMPQNTFKARISSGSGLPENLTATQATSLLNVFVPSGPTHAKGLVPTPPLSVGNTKFLREDAIWIEPTIVVGDGLTGDGTAGDPVTWPGVFTDGPLTGSGTSLIPLDILNNSITTNHIQDKTILFGDWDQNGAATGQVPQWNGTTWVAGTVNSLPSGSIGDFLIHNGTTWTAHSYIVERQTAITGNNVVLGTTPINYPLPLVFLNGYLLTPVDDYTLLGSTLTFINTLVSTDKITILYYS
jgi:hypothetical protein